MCLYFFSLGSICFSSFSIDFVKKNKCFRPICSLSPKIKTQIFGSISWKLCWHLLYVKKVIDDAPTDIFLPRSYKNYTFYKNRPQIWFFCKKKKKEFQKSFSLLKLCNFVCDLFRKRFKMWLNQLKLSKPFRKSYTLKIFALSSIEIDLSN